jgi:hypothetical protein
MDINKIFQITNFIDNARWGKAKENYNLINYYRDDISNNIKLLTHWISYITDRQMSFMQIWDVGGFVFSNLLDEIYKHKNDADVIDKFLNPKNKDSFFIKRGSYQYKVERNINNADFNKYLFAAKSQSDNNERLKQYGFTGKMNPYFISRYYPSDYYSILSTLCILQDYDFNFVKYISQSIEGKTQPLIIKMIFVLYLLTYYDIGQKELSDLNGYSNLKSKALKRKKKVVDIINNNKLFDVEYDQFVKGKIYNQKRAWCSLRDYLKSQFKIEFQNEMKKHNQSVYVNLFQDEMLREQHFPYLELPGDVWNNNSTFRKCLFGNLHDSIKGSPEFIRRIYNENNIKIGYPEQFDVTFDFVPRMCNIFENCKICPFGLMNGKAINFDKLCIKDTKLLCPILYVSCNYKMNCKADKCELIKIKENLN